MSLLEMIVIGVALAMDASCVSIANSMNTDPATRRFSHLLLPALLFGVFQAIMPVIGFFAGGLVIDFFARFSSWLVFGIFLLLGMKMIRDALSADGGEDSARSVLTLTPKLLLVQAVATSIDALAVGVSFCALSVNIFLPALIIGVTTVILCVAAGYLGQRLGDHMTKKAGIFGGGLLLLLALKALVAAISNG